MANKLEFPVGDREYGAVVQVSKSLAYLPTKEPDIIWNANEALAISSTALALTANLAENADVVLITFETAQVRYFVHGPVPTASTGHLVSAGDILELKGRAEIDQFRCIRVSVDAAATVSYGRRVVLA